MAAVLLVSIKAGVVYVTGPAGQLRVAAAPGGRLYVSVYAGVVFVTGPAGQLRVAAAPGGRLC